MGFKFINSRRYCLWVKYTNDCSKEEVKEHEPINRQFVVLFFILFVALSSNKFHVVIWATAKIKSRRVAFHRCEDSQKDTSKHNPQYICHIAEPVECLRRNQFFKMLHVAIYRFLSDKMIKYILACVQASAISFVTRGTKEIADVCPQARDDVEDSRKH